METLSSDVPSLAGLPVLRAAFLHLTNKMEKRKQEKPATMNVGTVSQNIQRPVIVPSAFPFSQLGIVTLVSVFTLSLSALLIIYFTMPAFDTEMLKVPKCLEDIQTMKEHISVYTNDYICHVVIGYVSMYIFMQTFMIPGTIFLSLLAGDLFGLYRGLLLVIFSATAGASSCYLLSKLFGASLVMWLWPNQIKFFRVEVAKHQGRLLNYMLFLRVTPTLPNVLINFVAPIVDIPYHIFFFATVIGLIPASFLSVRAGLTLGQLKSVADLYDARTISGLFVLGVLFILPTVITRHVKAHA